MRLGGTQRRWLALGVLGMAAVGVGVWLWPTRPTPPPPPSEHVTELAWRLEVVPGAPHPHAARAWILRARYADGYEAIGGRPVLATDFAPPGHTTAPVLELVDRLPCAGETCAWMETDPLFGPPYCMGPHPQDLVYNLNDPPGPPGCLVRIRLTVTPGDRWTAWLVGQALLSRWASRRLSWLPLPEAGNYEGFLTLSTTVPGTPCEQVRQRLFATP